MGGMALLWSSNGAGVTARLKEYRAFFAEGGCFWPGVASDVVRAERECACSILAKWQSLNSEETDYGLPPYSSYAANLKTNTTEPTIV